MTTNRVYSKYRNKNQLSQDAKFNTGKMHSDTVWGRSKSLRFQKVYPRLVKKVRLLNVPDTHSTPFFQKIKQKSKLFLILFLASVVIFIFVPFVMRVKSYMWERQRTLILSSDPLYDLFLVEGLNLDKTDTREGLNLDKTDTRSGAATGIDRTYKVPSLTTRTYSVKKGDSLFGIARRFNVSIDTVISANGLKNAYYLSIGMKLQIPNLSGVYYRVRKGDSLSSIAARYTISINKIADINDLPSSVIHVGDALFIPGGTLSSWERATALGNLFKKPTTGRLTSRMGFRKDPFTGMRAYHAGIDIANRRGTQVYAAQYGRIVFTGYRGNYGRTIIIRHPQGYVTIYAHLDKIFVRRSQTVQQGDKIGTMGNTGRSTGPHLHFEIHQYNKLLDPLKILRM